MDRDALIAQLKVHEGWEPSVYQDTRGFWTIGYGFLVDETLGGELPREVGEFWLEWLVGRLERNLLDALANFTQYPEQVQQALANMAYQMGIKGLLSFKRMFYFLDMNEWEQAADEALDSRWAIQTPNRAQEVSDMIRAAE